MAEFSNVKVIPMGAESAKLLASIHMEVFKDAPEQIWDYKSFQTLNEVTGTIAYVICLDNQPIGFSVIRIVLDEAEIITFCILPKWCNSGYATFLLEWIIDTLQMRFIKRLFLEVRENNDAAIRLYDKCSFKIIGRRKGYYQGHNRDKEDALVMQIQLIE